ncbi:MAG: hypothetical protein ACYC99_16040 [Candidatus Geothermincolia bacterium]
MLRKTAVIFLVLVIALCLQGGSLLFPAAARAETWTPVATGGIEGNYARMSFGSQLVEYNTKLYALTDGPVSGCRVLFKPATGTTWTETCEPGFGNSNNYYASAGVGFGGYLYVGTLNNVNGCEVWRTAETATVPYTDWQKVASGGFDTTNNTSVSCMYVYNGQIFAGTQNTGDTGKIYASDNGTTWKHVSDTNIEVLASYQVYSMVQFGTYLYAGTEFGIFRTDANASTPSPYTWTSVVDSYTVIDPILAVSGDGNTLYAGSSTASGCQLFASQGVGGPPFTDWTKINLDGFSNPDNNAGAASMAVFNSQLYVGTRAAYGLGVPMKGGQVWRYNGGGVSDWTQVAVSGFGDDANYSLLSMLVFDSHLCASTMNGVSPGAPFTHGAVVMATEGAGGPPYTDWARINDKGFAPNANESACLAFYNGYLYAGTSNWAGCQVWKKGSGGWTQVNTDGFGVIWNSHLNSLQVWGGYLYAATSDIKDGGQVWRYNGSSWVEVAPRGFGDTENSAVGPLVVKGSYLYAGTSDHDDGNCEIWRTAGGATPTWTKVNADGFGDPQKPYIGAIATDGTYLYAGTAYTSNGCQLWRSACSGTPPFTDWTKVNAAGFGDTSSQTIESIAFLSSGIYVGTSGTTGKVLRSFAAGGPPYTDWKLVNAAGFGNADNTGVLSLAVLSARLFASTANWNDGCDVWRCAATGGPPFTDWSAAGLAGLGDSNNVGGSSLIVSGADIYVGTGNLADGCQVLKATPVFPAPTVTGINPSSGDNNSTVSVSNLAGTGFTGSGVTVKLKKSGQTDIPATNVSVVSTSRISCAFDIRGAQTGTWDVYVCNADGKSGTKVGAFTVNKPVYPTWYLAEGTTAWGFSTYVSIANPNSSALSATVTYMPTGAAPVAETVNLPANSQTTLTNDHLVEKMGGQKDFSTKVDCTDKTRTIAVDRTMTWSGGTAETGVGQEAHNSVGVPAPAKAWYLPEGSSSWGFECWLLIQNPGAAAAHCTVTYMIEGEGPLDIPHTVDPNSRATFNLATDIGNKDASIKVVSDVPVIPERAMYRNSRREGHDSIGTIAPASSYYLAEGTTAWGFTTYVLIQNPQTSTTDVDITYMTGEGPVKNPETISMPAGTRKTIRVNDVPGMTDKDFSTLVQGNKPIIAERAMYWNSPTGEACHDSVGMDSAHTCFYLPDGQTSDGRETWTLIQNPNAVDVTVEVAYLPAGGGTPVVKTETIAASSRKTFGMLAHSGITGRASIMVTCTTPEKKIMCERAMYWGDRGAGTDTIGGYSD